jgi:hypothetical protein
LLATVFYNQTVTTPNGQLFQHVIRMWTPAQPEDHPRWRVGRCVVRELRFTMCRRCTIAAFVWAARSRREQVLRQAGDVDGAYLR